MARENSLWGAPRIHGELLKLGLDVSQATFAKYMARPRTPPSQSWRTFLTIIANKSLRADFFVVPTATCRLLFVLVILAHERRRVVHVAVTDQPTAAWTAQQLREAFPGTKLPDICSTIVFQPSTGGRPRRRRSAFRKFSRLHGHRARTPTRSA